MKGNQNFEMESNQVLNTTKNPKPPDLKEVLVYRILEYIGLGPKVHYFINSTARFGLFIATQDCSFTKNPELKTKKFTMACEVRELTQEPTTADEVGVTSLDMITRCLRIKDLHEKNYGRVDVIPTEGSGGEVKQKWKLIDFLVFTPGSLYFTEDIGHSFFSADDHPDDRFLSDGSFVRSIIKSEHFAANKYVIANSALAILEGTERRGEGAPEMSFVEAVTVAREEIIEFMKLHYVILGIDQTITLRDIEKYCESVVRNYFALKESIVNPSAIDLVK